MQYMQYIKVLSFPNESHPVYNVKIVLMLLSQASLLSLLLLSITLADRAPILPGLEPCLAVLSADGLVCTMRRERWLRRLPRSRAPPAVPLQKVLRDRVQGRGGWVPDLRV